MITELLSLILMCPKFLDSDFVSFHFHFLPLSWKFLFWQTLALNLIPLHFILACGWPWEQNICPQLLIWWWRYYSHHQTSWRILPNRVHLLFSTHLSFQLTWGPGASSGETNYVIFSKLFVLTTLLGHHVLQIFSLFVIGIVNPCNQVPREVTQYL